MNQAKGNYEKKWLAAMALLALIIAGLLIWQSSEFPATLAVRQVSPNDELGEVPVEKAQEATKRLQTVFDWTSPERKGKPVPLNKSILLVVKDDTLYDLFVEDKQLRPPMTNEFLIKYDLPHILHENLGELDPDNDGFTNEEEFLAGTNPRDPDSRPPATQKLFLKERVTNDYILLFVSSSSMQVQRLRPEPKRSTFVTVGQKFGFDQGVQRFEAISMEQKEVDDPRSGRRDVSELKCRDTATNSEFVLIRGEELNLAEFEAKFEFRLQTLREFTVKKGERFQLPGTGDTYIVLEVEETSARIAKVEADGQQGEVLSIPMR
jgi:hypothetical protein